MLELAGARANTLKRPRPFTFVATHDTTVNAIELAVPLAVQLAAPSGLGLA